MTSSSPVRARLTGVALGATTLAVLAGALAPAASAVPNPVSPAKAPATVEVLSPYIPQVSCDPTAKPGVLAFYNQMIATYSSGRSLGIVQSCSVVNTPGGVSEHKEGRALDWGLRVDTPSEKVVADQFLAWAIAKGPDGQVGYNARRLGINYMIFNKRIWGTYNTAAGWRPYNGVSPHTDHIHISFAWNGALKKTSWWTGKAAGVDYGPCQQISGLWAPKYSGVNPSPCAPAAPITSLTGSPVLVQGSTGVYVTLMQKYLGVTADGAFGPMTKSALVAFQKGKGLPQTGSTDVNTWKALRGGASGGGAVVKPTPAPPVPKPAPKPAPKPPVASTVGYVTYKVVAGDTLTRISVKYKTTVTALKSLNGLKSDMIQIGQVLKVTKTTVVAMKPPVKVSALTKYKSLVLKVGSRGTAVKAVQAAVGVPVKDRDGVFGPQTRSYVIKFQKAKKVKQSGVVDAATWKALGA